MNWSNEWYHSEFSKHEIREPHRAIEKEFLFYNAVANGDIDFVQKDCRDKNFTKMEDLGILSENKLQNLRYHFAIFSAMTTRCCVFAGMEQDKAYNLSDYYILKMDKCKTLDEISELHDIMSIDLCTQMMTLRKSQIFSKPIVLCINYIYNHIHSRITLKELADYLHISESYLSKLFNKEMGISVSKFIINEKIEKAKNLLRYSDLSISDISNYYSFSSQSHFIQVFQRNIGLTPCKYRAQHFRTDWEELNASDHTKESDTLCTSK